MVQISNQFNRTFLRKRPPTALSKISPGTTFASCPPISAFVFMEGNYESISPISSLGYLELAGCHYGRGPELALCSAASLSFRCGRIARSALATHRPGTPKLSGHLRLYVSFRET